MGKNSIIDVYSFGIEIGKLGFDENRNVSFFQYHPDILKNNLYPSIFPYSIKRIAQTQVFSKYNTETFRGLPPIFADSLPDMFGNIIFKAWLENNHKDFKQINAIEQLAYVGNRGMGVLEYFPANEIPKGTSIDLTEITEVLKNVLEIKHTTKASKLNNQSLLNIFKIGSSAGGVRPKILISENKKTKEIISGDLEYSNEFNHYLVKLNLEENSYNAEKIEFCYYQLAKLAGIDMMPSKLIDDMHFATLRFDRQEGKKKHVLTASGITGWDFKNPEVSSYENLFELALYLKLPPKEIEELFRRMVFNVVFCNADDHLKNHAFMYNEQFDKWSLAPAYDITYSLNPIINFKKTSRALSINNKRVDITLDDIKTIAETFTIKNPKKIISQIQELTTKWRELAEKVEIEKKIIQNIANDFKKIL
jgi:serine/threonine-protein kinase HipA